MNKLWYQTRYRRLLVDMHIPDWDARFLAQYDPRTLTDAYERAGATSVMFYCQSHIGLCYFPTKTGKAHPALRGRDWVSETLALLKAKDITAVGYYSVNYNAWAFWEHPNWRTVPGGDAAKNSFNHSRYGTCCLNHPEYRAFVLAQLSEIFDGRTFDGFFVDDSFWPTVCVCPQCRERFRTETGCEIPETVDWFDPIWCEFQACRERWLSEYVGQISDHLHTLQPGVAVYHNFGVALGHWSFAVPFESAAHHEFLGGDLFGDPLQQLMVIKWMTNLTPHRPMEFMTSHTTGVREHVQLKSLEQWRLQAYAATLLSSAFLFIDWINPDGTINPAVYDRIGQVYNEVSAYEPFLGGEPVEDIAIYFSYDAKVDFAENGRPLQAVDPWSDTFESPHVRAVRGVVRSLQRAHLPFGIITSKQLNELHRYKLVILPNVLRMSAAEAEAFRGYVKQGGALYASRYSSLVETRGVFHDDFMLADVFGVHFAADDIGSMSYLQPQRDEVAATIAPQKYLTLSPELVMFGPHKDKPAVKPLRLSATAEGATLGTLTLPYSNEFSGTVFDHHWSSIHSSPQWQDTPHPTLVQHHFGAGDVIYSAADIESLDADAPNALLLHCIQTLLHTAPTYATDAPPAVWMNVSRQKQPLMRQKQPLMRQKQPLMPQEQSLMPQEQSLMPQEQPLMQQTVGQGTRTIVGFLNYQAQSPVIPIQTLTFEIQPPAGEKFTGVKRLPEETPVEFTCDARGTLHATVRDLDLFAMFAVESMPTDRTQ